MVHVTTYCQASYLLSGKLPTVRQAISRMKLAPNSRIHAPKRLRRLAPNNRIHAPNRSIDMHPKGIDMHPKGIDMHPTVSIDLHPTTAYFLK